MKLLAYAAAATLLVSAGSATALAKSKPSEKPPQERLRDSLNAMALGAASNGDHPPGQSKRPDDPDQGDDNAADRAILEVCYKNTPAAERSAICDGEPVSPQ